MAQTMGDRADSLVFQETLRRVRQELHNEIADQQPPVCGCLTEAEELDHLLIKHSVSPDNWNRAARLVHLKNILSQDTQPSTAARNPSLWEIFEQHASSADLTTRVLVFVEERLNQIETRSRHSRITNSRNGSMLHLGELEVLRFSLSREATSPETEFQTRKFAGRATALMSLATAALCSFAAAHEAATAAGLGLCSGLFGYVFVAEVVVPITKQWSSLAKTVWLKIRLPGIKSPTLGHAQQELSAQCIQCDFSYRISNANELVVTAQPKIVLGGSMSFTGLS